MLQWVALYFGLAVLGTWLAIRYAVWRGLFDHPGARRSHAQATARGGGAAIVAALLVAAIWLALRHPSEQLLLGAFSLGLSLVAGIGLLDDHRPLSARVRLAMHALAASLMGLALFAASGDWRLVVIAVLAIVVLTNVWNFMDGINGLAASQALLIGVLLADGAGSIGSWALMAAALAAACAGFLPYNFPKARIFLGDVGSGSIGFALAVLLVVKGGQGEKSSWLLLLPVSAFLVDSGLTLLRRIVRRETWWTAHTQHAYQVWARRAGHATVTLAYAAWTLAGCALVVVGSNLPVAFMLGVTAAWYTSAGSLWWLLQTMDPEKRQAVQSKGMDT